MRINAPTHRTAPEPLLPMIDVVFFLVVFFMLVSRLAAPEPFAVSAPQAAGRAVEGTFALYLDAEGELGFVGAAGTTTGEGALAALTSARQAWCEENDCVASPPPLLLYADAAVEAARLAVLLPMLAASNFTDLSLVTVSP